MLNFITVITIIVYVIIIIVYDTVRFSKNKGFPIIWFAQILCFMFIILSMIIYPHTDAYEYDPDKIVHYSVTRHRRHRVTTEYYEHMLTPEEMQFEGDLFIWVLGAVYHLICVRTDDDNDD